MWSQSMTKKKPYHHNNWQLYKDSDDSMFIPHEFDEFIDWKLGGWELPSSVCCIIREENPETGRIKEYVYTRTHAAKNKVSKLMKNKRNIVVCNNEAITNAYPKGGSYEVT